MARVASAARTAATDIPFGDKLILFRYFLHLFGKETLKGLAGELNHKDYEGLSESQNTLFWAYLDQQAFLHRDSVLISRDDLRRYDENICRHARRIGEKRGGLTLKYFQYISLLFTEIYLDKYFSDKEAFAAELNAFRDTLTANGTALGAALEKPFDTKGMNKLAYMCATGSGKTLMMHANILQFLHYQRRALRSGKHVQINRIIVLAPNEGMSLQHLDELALSSIHAEPFMKDSGFVSQAREMVIVIDMNKLKEEGKKKTVSVDSFEQNNLVLVDEAHRGLTGDVWYDYRTRLSCDGGFSFEYSATFKQALRSAKATDKKARAAMDEYAKTIIMDYSYKFFFTDGYGKDYRIYNLKESIDPAQKKLHLTGCLMSYYQQLFLFEKKRTEFAPFQIERPLLVFVGNRVTANTAGEDLTDVEEVLSFLDDFVRHKTATIKSINAVLNGDTGLMDGLGRELFYGDFDSIKQILGHQVDGEMIFADMMHRLFNTDTVADEPRLRVENLKQADGEIGLRIGEQGAYFGVINIGDPATLIKNCQDKGIVSRTEEFATGSLFRALNDTSSRIHMLIGSRKFTEGWNSWRVSTMGLINFAKGEGSQAIQLFGRGVRLHGYGGCLKRSSELDEAAPIPKGITALETLTIFGIKAQYMEDFRHYLELEDMPTDKPLEYKLPVVNRFGGLKGKNLQVIRLPESVSFKKQAARLLLRAPGTDEAFLRYLVKNRALIDCRSKVQTIQSDFSMRMESTTQEYRLPPQALPLLDYRRIYAELEQYKNEKTLYNLSIDFAALKGILETDGWYALQIPQVHIAFDSPGKLSLYTDFAVSALKIYIDKFCKYYRAQWEAPKMTYLPLRADDGNFVTEYTIRYVPEGPSDSTGDSIASFVEETKSLLDKHGYIPGYARSMHHDLITVFDFRNHLYAPLISIAGGSLKITGSPVSLNKGEKLLVDRLNSFCAQYPNLLKGTDLYLLRNKSKAGMGFFEAGNFYPDYVLWLDTTQKQTIVFIDPKGLLHVRPDDPKITFFQTIKELEGRMHAKDHKPVVLESFIMSSTPSADLRLFWQMDREARNKHHVMCLDEPDCVEKMMGMLLH